MQDIRVVLRCRFFASFSNDAKLRQTQLFRSRVKWCAHSNSIYAVALYVCRMQQANNTKSRGFSLQDIGDFVRSPNRTNK